MVTRLSSEFANSILKDDCHLVVAASAKTPQEKESVQWQIESTDGMIDKLVYELYGLTEEEIGVVEGK